MSGELDSHLRGLDLNTPNCPGTFINWSCMLTLTEMGIPDHLTCLLRNLYAGQEQQLELDMEQWTTCKLGKEYVKAVYCHPAYLTYMQSTS